MGNSREMTTENKYLLDEVGTSNGFWYDLTAGGYIRPEEVLADQVRAAELNAAVKLLRDWEQELIADEILNQF